MIPTLNRATAGGGLALPEFVQLAARHGFNGVEFSIDEVDGGGRWRGSSSGIHVGHLRWAARRQQR